MKVFNDNLDFRNFKAWSGAVDVQNRIIEEGKEEAFERLIDELYPDGIDETHLNDLLWFDTEWVYEQLGIKDEDEEEEE